MDTSRGIMDELLILKEMMIGLSNSVRNVEERLKQLEESQRLILNHLGLKDEENGRVEVHAYDRPPKLPPPPSRKPSHMSLQKLPSLEYASQGNDTYHSLISPRIPASPASKNGNLLGKLTSLFPKNGPKGGKEEARSARESLKYSQIIKSQEAQLESSTDHFTDGPSEQSFREEISLNEFSRMIGSAIQNSTDIEDDIKNFLQKSKGFWHKSMNYAEALVMSSTYFEYHKDTLKSGYYLLEAAHFLTNQDWKQFAPEEPEKAADIFLKSSIYLYKNSQFEEAKAWALQSLEIRKNMAWNSESRLTSGARAFEHTGAVCQQLGQYREGLFYLETAFQICLELAPTSLQSLEAMEILTNSFHLQGKTDMAIERIETMIKKIEEYIERKQSERMEDEKNVNLNIDKSTTEETYSTTSPGTTEESCDEKGSFKGSSLTVSLNGISIDIKNKITQGHLALQQLYSRGLYLHFIIEQYSEAQQFLQRCISHSEIHNLDIPPQTLCVAYCLYNELGEIRKFKEFEEKIIETHQAGYTIPLSRSKYLGTLECQFIDKTCSIKLRINRTRPHYVEGEKPVKIERCLKNGQLEFSITPISQIEEGGKELISLNTMKSYEIRHKFVGLQFDEEKLNWFRIQVLIYNSSKTNKLGEHYQLALYSPKKTN